MDYLQEDILLGLWRRKMQMICRRCMVVMRTGTRYEQSEEKKDSLSHKRYFECRKCHDRVYTNAPNFQDTMTRALEKSRNR